MRKLLLSVFFITTLSVSAQDRYFGQTYTSNILPKGAVDVEFWHSAKIGHSNQFFHEQDQRLELEFGLGKNLQTAFYFNHYQKRFSESAEGTTTSSEIGFSNEWKWKLFDPGKKKIGLALYGEWGIKGGDELELELKIIADKTMDKNLFAFNGTLEFEKEFEWKNNKLSSDSRTASLEFNLAWMYQLSVPVGLGFEVCNRNKISKNKVWENSVFFGGPTFNYRGNNWFVIVNYLPQWVNVHKTIYAPFSKVLDERERMEARIIVGISLK